MWQLLHVFFVSQGRVVGSIALDLAHWLFTNASLLCGGFTPDEALSQVRPQPRPVVVVCTTTTTTIIISSNVLNGHDDNDDHH